MKTSRETQPVTRGGSADDWLALPTDHGSLLLISQQRRKTPILEVVEAKNLDDARRAAYLYRELAATIGRWKGSTPRHHTTVTDASLRAASRPLSFETESMHSSPHTSNSTLHYGPAPYPSRRYTDSLLAAPQNSAASPAHVIPHCPPATSTVAFASLSPQ
jgi:hypothetical protein